MPLPLRRPTTLPEYYASAKWAQGHDPCDDWPRPWPTPDQPNPRFARHVWYRGWEIGFSHEAEYWSEQGWIAYKGGCDLGAPEVRASTYQACLDEIDMEEEG